jgi:hypothetical protein
MPGTPHHALGDPVLTLTATTALSLAVVSSAVLLRNRSTDVRRYTVKAAMAYAAAYVSLWAVVPAAFWRFSVTMENIGFVVVVLGMATVVIASQAGLPVYLYADRGLKAPIIGMFVVSWVCGYLFLLVGGESGSTFTLFLWSFMIGPLGIAGIGLLGALEVGFRRVTGGRRRKKRT